VEPPGSLSINLMSNRKEAYTAMGYSKP
jgi:hypothetical protein